MAGLGFADGAQDAALAIIVTLATLVGFLAARAWTSLSASQERRFRRPYRPSKFKQDRGPDLTDVGQQLLAVMAGSFEKQKLLNYSEYRAFKVIADDLAHARKGYRVFAQTNLGEILRSKDENAFRSINSKRVDILIIDRNGWPIMAVEYQGNGHYQGTAAARDAVKKEALRKAGVKYIEVCETDSDDQIRSRVREQLSLNIDPT